MDNVMKFISGPIERQIPKKPVWDGDTHSDVYDIWYCPSCGEGHHEYVKHFYCPNCEQKIDWSEENDSNTTQKI